MASRGTAAAAPDRAVALAVFATTTALLAWGAGDGSVANGDEATYALFARGLRAGDLLHLRLGGEVLHQRPPLYPWLLAASTALFGETPFALRLPSILAGGASAVLVLRLGAALLGRFGGVVAAALLPTFALQALYARAVTSDALLTFLVLLAIERAWAGRRGDRQGAVIAAGAALGGAVMTKQVVGLLPLVALAALTLAGGWRALPPRRQLLAAAATALAVALPWHVAALVVDGREFVDGYLGFNVLRRATTPLLPPTGPGYYLEALARKEGALVAASAVGLVLVAIRFVRFRRAGDLLLVLWPLVVLCAFSAVPTRIDYYVLPAVPALALLAAAPLAELARRRRALAGALAAALVAGAALAHVPRRLREVDRSAELRLLAVTARAVSRADDPLLVIDDLPFAPAWYARRQVELVVTRRANHDALAGIDVFRAARLVHVPPEDLPGWLAARERWLAIQPIAELRHPSPPGARLFASTPRYVLYGRLPP